MRTSEICQLNRNPDQLDYRRPGIAPILHLAETVLRPVSRSHFPLVLASLEHWFVSRIKPNNPIVFPRKASPQILVEWGNEKQTQISLEKITITTGSKSITHLIHDIFA